MARWNELDRYDGPWIDVFVLMWEAYTAGTIPVGAVVTDGTGKVVARGRNRILDAPAEGELGGSRLAHAEVNALLALPSTQLYESSTLYSSLEPCPLCLPWPSRGLTGQIEGRLEGTGRSLGPGEGPRGARPQIQVQEE